MPAQMLTNIEYWFVGSTASSYLPVSMDEMSAHLMNDLIALPEQELGAIAALYRALGLGWTETPYGRKNAK